MISSPKRPRKKVVPAVGWNPRSNWPPAPEESEPPPSFLACPLAVSSYWMLQIESGIVNAWTNWIPAIAEQGGGGQKGKIEPVYKNQGPPGEEKETPSPEKPMNLPEKLSYMPSKST